ncbi:hypothetical protein [Streptomyces sp. 2A115]
MKCLTTLAEKVGRERYDAEFTKAVNGTGIESHTPWERTATAVKQLSKAR